MRLKEIFGSFQAQKEKLEEEKHKKWEQRMNKLYGFNLNNHYVTPPSGTSASVINGNISPSNNDIEPEDYF